MAQQAASPAPKAGGNTGSATPAGGAATPLQKNVEAFLRNVYALGPEVSIVVGAPTELGNSGILETAIDVKTPEGAENVKMLPH